MRLRTALAKSKNLVTVRVLQAIGPQYAQDYITRFGFDPKLHPAYLTMGLGAGSATPLQMAAAYAVFANGGYRVTPYLIAKITDARGNVLSEAKPDVAGEDAERAIDPRNAFIMTTLLRDVIAFGTGDARAGAAAARTSPARPARPTRTSTRGSAASTPTQVGIAWIGFDQPKTLGTNETGGVAALPIWIAYMQKALKGVPEKPLAGARGRRLACASTPETGLRDDSSSLSDWFYAEFPPRGARRTRWRRRCRAAAPAQDVRDQLF